MMEVFAPKVHDTRYLPRNDAVRVFIEAIYRDVTLSGLINGYDDATYVADLTLLAQDPDFDYPQGSVGLPPDVTMPLNQVQGKNEQAAMGILWITGKRVARLDHRPAEVLVHCLCALAKQGNATTAFVDKITAGYRNDTGRAMNLEVEGINACWDLLVHHVDDGNVGEVITRWLQFLPHEALRLRITLEQIPGEGLTCITTIIKAMTDFPAFDWVWVYYNFPGEYNKACVAIQEITGKPYYGYRMDLSLVKSANYRTLGYISQQLMIKAGGEGPLRAAMCFTRTPKFKLKLDEMIDDFVMDATTITPLPGTPVPLWMTNVLANYIAGGNPGAGQPPPNQPGGPPAGGPPAPPGPPPHPPGGQPPQQPGPNIPPGPQQPAQGGPNPNQGPGNPPAGGGGNVAAPNQNVGVAGPVGPQPQVPPQVNPQGGVPPGNPQQPQGQQAAQVPPVPVPDDGAAAAQAVPVPGAVGGTRPATGRGTASAPAVISRHGTKP